MWLLQFVTDVFQLCEFERTKLCDKLESNTEVQDITQHNAGPFTVRLIGSAQPADLQTRATAPKGSMLKIAQVSKLLEPDSQHSTVGSTANPTHDTHTHTQKPQTREQQLPVAKLNTEQIS